MYHSYFLTISANNSIFNKTVDVPFKLKNRKSIDALIENCKKKYVDDSLVILSIYYLGSVRLKAQEIEERRR
jgi:hypothetical protein